mgnify:CR=1 FL=1
MTCTEYCSHDLSTIEVSASIKRTRKYRTGLVLTRFSLQNAKAAGVKTGYQTFSVKNAYLDVAPSLDLHGHQTRPHRLP